MKVLATRLTVLFIGLLFLLTACGGGGGGTSGTPNNAGNAPTASQTVSGVAASGTPISGTVYLKDSSSPAKELSTPINADGSFSFDVAGLSAPYLLKAVGTANGQNYTLYSFAGAPGTANINPLSHVAVVRANGGADPASLYATPTAAQMQTINAALAQIISQLQALFQQVLSQYGAATTNFISDAYRANHLGLDLMFDLVAIVVNNGNLTVTNRISGGAILSTTLNSDTLTGQVVTTNIPTISTQTAGAVYVYPASSSVTVGGTVTFKAIVMGATNQSVTWSVVESGGGSVTSAGVYTAPSSVTGTYHVIATNVADNSRTATVTITVTSSSTIPASGLLGGTIQKMPLTLNGSISTYAVLNGFINGLITDGTNLYFNVGYAVCMANIATSQVTVIAGSITIPGAADGTASSARFADIYDLTVVGSNLYVLDGNNYTIRKVEIATGKVTTFAGQMGVSGHTDGTGTSATLGEAFGITNDGTNLYVVDESVIRKVEIATGKVTTIAGVAGTTGYVDGIGTVARFGQPIGITTDGTNLYVADNNTPVNISQGYYQAGTIRKIVLATGQVSTIAGSATVSGNTDGRGLSATFNYPSGITTDGTNLYITQQGGGVRKLAISSGQVSTLTTGSGNSGITTDGTVLYIGVFGATSPYYYIAKFY